MITDTYKEILHTNGTDYPAPLSKLFPVGTDLIENKLIHSERMATLGLLAGGIAHEINNPLNYIINSIKPLRRNIDAFIDGLKLLEMICENEKSDDIRNLLQRLDLETRRNRITNLTDSIQEGSHRIHQIIHDMLAFSKNKPEERIAVDIGNLIESVIGLFFGQYKSKIKFLIKIKQRTEIQGNPGELSQVFVNLINNAVQAIDNKQGTVKIESMLSKNTITIQIEDSGPGIPADMESLLFQPFFSTKDSGTGLGLSICKQIIERHNGIITLENNPAGGARAIIALPAWKGGEFYGH